MDEPKVIHVAGPYVQCGTRIIQRCAVCGEKLVDATLEKPKVGRVVVQLRLLGAGHLFSKVGEDFEHYGPYVNNKVPPGFCVELVEQ
jgi:hypothetical protein